MRELFLQAIGRGNQSCEKAKDAFTILKHKGSGQDVPLSMYFFSLSVITVLDCYKCFVISSPDICTFFPSRRIIVLSLALTLFLDLVLKDS